LTTNPIGFWVKTHLFVLILLAWAGSATRAKDLSGLSFEWSGPSYRLTTLITPDGQRYDRVEADGFITTALPGQPALPRRGHLVALPPAGDFGLEVLDVAYDTVQLEHPIEPAPGPPLSTHAVSPANDWLTLGDAAWMREHRLAPLTFVPFRYHPERQTLDVLRHIRFRVWWEGDGEGRRTNDEGRTTNDEELAPPASLSLRGDVSAAQGRKTAADLLRPLILNPAEMETFRAPPPFPNLPIYQFPNSFTHKILVETEGIYALDYMMLSTSGLPVASIHPSTLQLFHAGEQVAAQWEGDGDGQFESGERLLFYARPALTRYAGYDVYGLAWGQASGLRMAARSGDPSGLPAGVAWATALAEENAAYLSLYADHSGDRWFWRQLKLPDATQASFSVTLQTPQAGTAGQLSVWLQGATFALQNPDHHVQFQVNGSDVGEAAWDGATAYTATLDIPAGILQTGSNTVTLSLPGDTGAFGEAAWVDALAIVTGLDAVSGDVARFRSETVAHAYTVGGFGANVRAYDVSNPHAPQIVTGFGFGGGTVTLGDRSSVPAEYLLLTDDQIRAPQAVVPIKTLADPLLRAEPQDEAAGADYVVLTHPDFESALAPLVAHREAQGLRVAVVDVEAVYDRFGDGRMDPAAIHAFLSHAYTTWAAPPPTYVLLVGDGTYDPRGYQADSNPTYLPPYLANVDPWLGEVGSDNRYADLSGDALPELRVGRLPVNSPAEVTAVVDKIVQYETNPLPGDWNRRLLFGADNPSTAGDHHADADSEYLTYATPGYGFAGARVYLAETGQDPHLYSDAEAAQDALVKELNRGALLYSYFGHASWHQEAVLENDNWAPLFHVDHIARLNNTRRWPVVLQMTCYTGYYFKPTGATLDESLLRAEDVGAAAVWGPSGNGVATGHHTLHQGFYRAVFDDGQTELGAATHAALAGLYAIGLHNDLIETYHLFGDPALELHLTVVDWPFSLFLPIIARASP